TNKKGGRMRAHDTRRGRLTLAARRALAALSIPVVLLGVSTILGDERAADLHDAASPIDEPGAETQSSTALAEAREEFVAALRAAQAGADRAGAAGDSERLREYPLYPYLEAARLERALATAAGPSADVDTESRAFLERQRDAPVARSVRRARLESFARREMWHALLAEADPDTSNEALRCARLRARIALDDIEGIAPEIVDVWLTGRRLPLDCEPVFEWLRAEGLMTADLVERRVRLLLENGQADFARVIANRLPAERAAPWLRWADLIERPRDALDRLIAAPSTPLP